MTATPCPSLEQLPPPTSERVGFPWTQATPTRDAENWPSIGLVVPSFNQASTIQRTLRSILLQGYPRLELVVIDGGSTDGSIDIIRRYDSHLTCWVSEPDNGQSDAINKGFNHLSADVVNWLGTDDYLLEGALQTVGETFAQNPELGAIAGACENLVGGDMTGHVSHVFRPQPDRFKYMPAQNMIAQPACFFRRDLLDSPPLDPELHFAMDFDLWCRFQRKGIQWATTAQPLAGFRFSSSNKSVVGGERIVEELDRIYRRHAEDRVPLSGWHRRLRWPIERFRARHPRWSAPARLIELAIAGLLMPFYGYHRVRLMNWHGCATGYDPQSSR